MNKLISLILSLFFICIGNTFANDAYVTAAGGNILPVGVESHPTISMVSEVIQITLLRENYHVHVDFEFYNSGDQAVVDVGFPQWRYGTGEIGKFTSFTTTLNGNKIEYTEMSNNAQENDYIKIDKWFVRKITFPKNAITRTSVDYYADYSHLGFYEGVEYLFGTGCSWKNPIKKQTFIISNNGGINDVIFNIYFKEKKSYKDGNSTSSISRNKKDLIIVRENVSPDINDVIRIETCSFYYAINPMKKLEESSWRLSNEVIFPETLKYFTDDQLRLYRNLIYAWHGNIFKAKDINNWLKNAASDWYKPTHQVDISEFNEIEKINLKNIMDEEAKRNCKTPYVDNF